MPAEAESLPVSFISTCPISDSRFPSGCFVTGCLNGASSLSMLNLIPGLTESFAPISTVTFLSSTGYYPAVQGFKESRRVVPHFVEGVGAADTFTQRTKSKRTKKRKNKEYMEFHAPLFPFSSANFSLSFTFVFCIVSFYYLPTASLSIKGIWKKFLLILF